HGAEPPQPPLLGQLVVELAGDEVLVVLTERDLRLGGSGSRICIGLQKQPARGERILDFGGRSLHAAGRRLQNGWAADRDDALGAVAALSAGGRTSPNRPRPSVAICRKSSRSSVSE